MKVLEKGPGWSIKVRCTGTGNGNGGCESLLLVEAGDIYVTCNSYYEDTEFFYTITCPVCGMKTDIPTGDIPYSIRTKKLKEYKEAHQRTHGRRR